ncbi:winged helix-turn-helix domain-containing protein [Stenotrophomonas sp.]|uniref:ArsR/SmtB family transcription factor n=1 Tax=Stenotrophomonas sp. TaxID=69392 RepID=UPI0028AEC3DC|nr:winged helix-turn-helix domain-containing protein [Stenotrophomonas sp.]
MVQSSGSFVAVGTLVGDPARAAMLLALMDGRAYTASELARVAGVMPQTASTHLRRLVEGGVLSVVSQGRHRYHQLATGEVAEMLEGILRFSSRAAPTLRTAALSDLRRARSCYRHMAGVHAVAITDHLLAAGHLQPAAAHWQVTDSGAAFLRSLGAPLDQALRQAHTLRPERYCRGCLDCTERRPHLAGVVGEAMLDSFLHNHWLRRVDGRRELRITPPGQQAFRSLFSIRA